MKSTLRLQLAAVGFIWQMLEKRGEACEMDKMWVTRELTLFFLLSMFYVAVRYLC